MPDAIITSTESTFGTISGTFLDTGATVSGTISGVVAGTLDGSVGVPGPQGPAGSQGPAGPQGQQGNPGVGVPAGGTAGQVLAKVDGVDYNTQWVNDSGAVVWGDITGTLSDQTDLQTALNLKAPLASPALSGVPTTPTAATLTSTTQIASTAFVQQELAAGTAVAKNLEVYVRNQTGATLTAGTIVYINGATGNRPTVTKAQANNDANSAQTFGFVKTSIADNGFGFVIVRGECENLDTSALTEGAQLYLSPTTAGTWTTTKPSAPQHLVYVGIVVRAHPTQGVILVAVQNGYELNELHDVQIVTPTNGQVLKYDSATGLWKNATDLNSGVWGSITGTLSSQTDLQTALDGKYSTSNPAGYITSSALAGYATESWVTSGFYPLSGNPSGFLTSSALTPYLLSSTAASTYYPLTNPSGYITSAALSGYATESFVTSQGYITSSALSPYLTSATAASTYQTLAGMSSYLTTSAAASTYFTIANAANKADLASPTFTGNPTAPTPATADNDTSIATTAFVKAQGYLTSAPVTSVAGRTGAVTLSNTDISGLGTLATINDAPSNGSQYARQNGTWQIVSGGGGPSSAVNIQTFGSPTTSGTFTWTKPAGAKWVEFYLWGAGGGGGSGARYPTTVGRSGGGAGGHGGVFCFRMNADYFNATETVTISPGGTGGASITVDNSNGIAGTPNPAGNGTQFANFCARPGVGGGAGTAGVANGGTAGTSIYNNVGNSIMSSGNGNTSNGGSAGNYTAASGGLTMNNPSGGGGGAGAAANSTTSAAGGAGGSYSALLVNASGFVTSVSGGAGGTTAGVQATNGVSAPATQFIRGGTGGGGGFYISGQAGGNGGNGGWPGGGGGGGGASNNGFASGRGGDGGNGFAVIITYL